MGQGWGCQLLPLYVTPTLGWDGELDSNRGHPMGLNPSAPTHFILSSAAFCPVPNEKHLVPLILVLQTFAENCEQTKQSPAHAGARGVQPRHRFQCPVMAGTWQTAGHRGCWEPGKRAGPGWRARLRALVQGVFFTLHSKGTGRLSQLPFLTNTPEGSVWHLPARR